MTYTKVIEETEYAIKSQMRRQPQQNRSQKRVELILDTTAKLIVESGLENVNASLIAQKSGIPVGTIYQFFTDVEAISTEIIIRTKKRIDGKILDELKKHALVTKDYKAAVDELINIVINGFRSEPGAVTIMNALMHTKQYAKSTRITIDRLTEFVAEALLMFNPLLTEEKRYLVATTILEGSYRVLEKILTENDPMLAEKYKNELATLMKEYLSVYLSDQNLA